MLQYCLYFVPLLFLSFLQLHEGFYKSYFATALHSTVAAAVLSLRQQLPAYSIAITGHSLGGALATMCALDLLVRLRLSQSSHIMWPSCECSGFFAEATRMNLKATICALAVVAGNVICMSCCKTWVALGNVPYLPGAMATSIGTVSWALELCC